MKVLDIDLDFFLADCCELALPGERPELLDHEPWSKDDVRRFLEHNCGLDKNKRLQGRIFETHDSALLFWEELIQKGKLTVPFDVTHVDAHSDLGIGRPGPAFVLNSVLPLEVEKRADIKRYYAMRQLDEANYLLFALAFRWVRSLENVRNKKSRRDIPDFAFKDKESGIYSHIKLSSFVSGLYEKQNGEEPVVQFRVFDNWEEYSGGEFDCVSVAISPRYSPKESDELLPVFAEYIDFV